MPEPYTAVGLIPSTLAVVSPSSSSTTRRTTTSRSAADRLRTAASIAGDSPSPKTGSSEPGTSAP